MCCHNISHHRNILYRFFFISKLKTSYGEVRWTYKKELVLFKLCGDECPKLVFVILLRSYRNSSMTNAFSSSLTISPTITSSTIQGKVTVT